MIQIKDNEVTSTAGMLVHRIGSEAYFHCATTLPGDSPAAFEEVTAIPTYSREEYRREVERLIALRYTTGQEIQFAREQDTAGMDYTIYLEYVSQCKLQAVENLTATAEGS